MRSSRLNTGRRSLLAVVGTVVLLGCQPSQPVAQNFEDCVRQGNPIMESYPRRCRSDDGTTFTEGFDAPSASSSVAATDKPAPTVGSGFVLVYFMNNIQDPEVLHCDLPLPVTRRVTGTGNVLAIAIQELLKGPTSQEASKGYYTSLPVGVTLLSVVQKEGTVTADFSTALQKDVAGSCRVQSIRAQIEQTLKRFPGVTTVTIRVNGKEEGVLQP